MEAERLPIVPPSVQPWPERDGVMSVNERDLFPFIRDLLRGPLHL